jgi:hypothetical protein
MEVLVRNGKTTNMRNNMALLTTVLPSSSTLSSRPCNINLSQLLCRPRTIILITLHRPTNLSSHSMVRNNLPSNFSLRSLLLMVTVCHLINHLMVDRPNSGLVPLSKLVLLLTIIVVVVALVMAVEATKPLSWALLFVWVLIMNAEVVIWLKRAMAFLISMQIINLHLHLSLSHLIKATHLKISEDSVHHLIPIHTTLALIGAEEEVQTFEAEIVAIFNNFHVGVAIITIVTKTMVTELLQKIITNLQVQMVRRRRSVELQTLLVLHQMALIMKTLKMRSMM